MADIDTLIVNGTIMTMNVHHQIISEGAIAIKDDIIVAVGSTSDLTDTYDARRVIDATNHAVLPGLMTVMSTRGIQ